MKMLQLSDETIRLARKAGLPLVRMGAMTPDRTWSVPVGDELVVLIEGRRVKGEHDDAALSRMILDSLPFGRRPGSGTSRVSGGRSISTAPTGCLAVDGVGPLSGIPLATATLTHSKVSRLELDSETSSTALYRYADRGPHIDTGE